MQREDLEQKINELNKPDYDFASHLTLTHLEHLTPETLKALDATGQISSTLHPIGAAVYAVLVIKGERIRRYPVFNASHFVGDNLSMEAIESFTKFASTLPWVNGIEWAPLEVGSDLYRLLGGGWHYAIQASGGNSIWYLTIDASHYGESDCDNLFKRQSQYVEVLKSTEDTTPLPQEELEKGLELLSELNVPILEKLKEGN